MRAKCTLVPVLALCLLSGTSYGGTAGIDVEQFTPNISGRGLFHTESADTHRQLDIGVGLLFHYAKSPFSLDRDRGGELVSDRITGNFLLSIGLTNWLELGAALPVALWNKESPVAGEAVNVSGLGAARLQMKFRMLKSATGGAILSFLPAVSFPTGNHNAFLGQNGVVVAPQLLLEFGGRVLRWLMNFGYSIRETAAFQQYLIRNELFASVGLGVRVSDALEIAAEAFGATPSRDPFGANERLNPLEVLAGFRIFPTDRIALWVGAGPGVTIGYGSPTYRVFAGLYFSPYDRDTDGDGVPDRIDRCPTEPGPRENHGCPWTDKDGDGVLDKDDKCPNVPGPKENDGCPWPDIDRDGVPDKDDKCPTIPGPKENQGCPWPDQDRDGVPDKDDKCPTVPGPIENQGCPWPDTDGDGVPDKDDKCPTIPGPKMNQGCPWPDTDKDGVPDKDDKCPNEPGPKENDGCPWPDADKDGVPDKDDKCPHQPGPKENHGCPWPDRDGDGVPDKDDQCPDQPGPASNRGCPFAGVTVTKERVQIHEQVFFRGGSAKILPRSYGLLNAVAQTLQAYPEIQLVEVQGHTDDVGPRKYNLRLSQKRAESVRAYLEGRGIERLRLLARGYGMDKPIRPVVKKRMKKKQLKEARALNRRVEFVILRRVEKSEK
jgi:outer membrane protein OmpA-like peptidoglycan-associated protein